MKKWSIASVSNKKTGHLSPGDIISILLKNKGISTKKQIEFFLTPPDPLLLSAKDVGISEKDLNIAIRRIHKAIDDKESIVVYADYDADGITAGAIMWEVIHALGGNIMPYIPHRAEEGYGLSKIGIDKVKSDYNPTLIITVDHGITAHQKVDYAKSLGIEVIVTDHHVKPDTLPDCPIVHTTLLAGSGVSWFVAKELLRSSKLEARSSNILELATVGTIADMVPLTGPNRSIAKSGLTQLNETKRVGLLALMTDAGLVKGNLGTYEVSHVLAPRLNAMGRLEHALDALRLLCTQQEEKAVLLARKLGLTNLERQQLTVDTTSHALKGLTTLKQGETLKKLLFVSHESYNQGVIGLVAGRIVEEYYRPAIVVAVGEVYSKASARSISGFNIVEAIRSCSDILVDVGGHPMAAGFTVETKNIEILKERLEELAGKALDEDALTRVLKIDLEIPLDTVTFDLWDNIRGFEPFGFGNPEPVFATKNVNVVDFRTVGNNNKHMKLRLSASSSKSEALISKFEAIAFGMGEYAGKLNAGDTIDIAYTVDVNVWNGNKNLQLKIKDIHID